MLGKKDNVMFHIIIEKEDFDLLFLPVLFKI